MQTQRELLEDTREEFAEKLDGLRTFLREVADRTEAHDTDEAHFEDDVMRAEHDARYYEDEIAWIDRALGRAVPQSRSGAGQGEIPWSLLSVAFLAGALVGRLLTPRRSGPSHRHRSA